MTFDSARHLRAGTHTRTDRLEQLYPVIEEMFHVQQDLLEKIVKTYYTSETAREGGTLANYRAVLHRNNVNGQVKANGYEAHKDFIITVARALIVELASEKLGLDRPGDIQTLMPTDLNTLNRKQKSDWLGNLIQPMVDTIFRQYTAPQKYVSVSLQYKGILYKVKIPPENIGKTVQIKLNGDLVLLRVPTDCEPDDTPDDELYAYSLSLIRLLVDFLVFDQAIRSGHIDIITIMMKRFIPLFVGLSSYKSKYAIECVNFLTKTECVLSDSESVRVKLGLLVNKKGKAGKNKPADMQQENNIRNVKHVIRGLGSGKSDKAMLRASKAAPVVSSIVKGLNKSIGKNEKGSHAKKSMASDINVLTEKMRLLKPLEIHHGRKCAMAKMSASVLCKVDKTKLQEFIVRHSIRAINMMEAVEDEDSVN